MKTIFFLIAFILSFCSKEKQNDDETRGSDQDASKLANEDYSGCEKSYIYNVREGETARIVVQPAKPHKDHATTIILHKKSSKDWSYPPAWDEDYLPLSTFYVQPGESFEIECSEVDLKTNMKKIGTRKISATIEVGKHSQQMHPGCFGVSKDGKNFITFESFPYYTDVKNQPKIIIRRNGKIIDLPKLEGKGHAASGLPYKTDDYYWETVVDDSPLSDQKNIYTCDYFYEGVEKRGAYSLVL